jgi:hypothetical protein
MLALMGVIAVIVSIIMVCPPHPSHTLWISVLTISDCNRLGPWCSIRPCMAGTEERQHAPKVCRAWRVITDSRPLIDTIPFVTMSYFTVHMHIYLLLIIFHHDLSFPVPMMQNFLARMSNCNPAFL